MQKKGIKIAMHPLVSVIIPNYNHARFLNERIESILCQTYKNYELIILDDKSTDNSVDIIQQYANNKHVTHVVINEENSGSPFIQWQKGIDLAKGELIWIAESDDACDQNILETLVKEFEQDPNCVLAFCMSIKINTDGMKIGEEGLNYSLHINGNQFIKEYLSRQNYISNASSAIFKKNMLSSIDQSFTNYRGCGDWLLWIEIAHCGNIAYVNAPLNYFRIHQSNTTIEQAFSGKNEIEGVKVYQFMRNKKYIGYKEELRARISHIYSVKYGKQHSFYSPETKKDIVKAWKETKIIKFLTWMIYLFQRHSKLQIIKR